MPYIKKERRKKFDPYLECTAHHIESEGELNYCLTRLALIYLRKRDGLSYAFLNTIIGAFESAKLEFYRRWVVPYEDKKINENGDVTWEKADRSEEVQTDYKIEEVQKI
ncbi:hypothetical protein KAR91_73145 [Candidatus Pacearchaeota archaeon]|nr:hypothetical protein [Candidatus Pacearchaeota archaeon]